MDNEKKINPLPFTPKFHIHIRDCEWQLVEGLRPGRSSLIFNLAVDEARAIKHAGHFVRISPSEQLASEIDSLSRTEIWKNDISL
jgi:hypothetical protein